MWPVTVADCFSPCTPRTQHAVLSFTLAHGGTEHDCRRCHRRTRTQARPWHCFRSMPSILWCCQSRITCLGSFRMLVVSSAAVKECLCLPSVLPDSSGFHRHGWVTRLGGRLHSAAIHRRQWGCRRVADLQPALSQSRSICGAPNDTPSLLHRSPSHKFHSTYKADSDDGSVQPAAPPLGSSQLLNLGNPPLELDILALLVAVSFVLSFPSAPVHPSQRQPSEDARPGISTAGRRCRSGTG